MEKVRKIAIFRMISFIFADFTLWLSGASRIAPGGYTRSKRSSLGLKGAIREGGYTRSFTVLN